MDGRLTPSEHWRVRLGWSIAVLACAVQTAAYLTNELVLDGRYHQLNLAADRTLFGWANTLAIVSLAVLVGLAAGRRLIGAGRAAVLVTGLGVLALDDTTGTHDRLRDLQGEWFPGPASAAAAVAVIGFALLLVIVFVLLWVESSRAEGASWMMRAGLLTLAFAIAVRIVGAASAQGTHSDTTRALGVAFEQGLDFLGWILVATGYAVALTRGSAAVHSSSPPPHWPALIASDTETPRPASMTAPTLPPGAAKTRRPSL